mgnify:FL=1
MVCVLLLLPPLLVASSVEPIEWSSQCRRFSGKFDANDVPLLGTTSSCDAPSGCVGAAVWRKVMVDPLLSFGTVIQPRDTPALIVNNEQSTARCNVACAADGRQAFLSDYDMYLHYDASRKSTSSVKGHPLGTKDRPSVCWSPVFAVLSRYVSEGERPVQLSYGTSGSHSGPRSRHYTGHAVDYGVIFGTSMRNDPSRCVAAITYLCQSNDAPLVTCTTARYPCCSFPISWRVGDEAPSEVQQGTMVCQAECKANHIHCELTSESVALPDLNYAPRLSHQDAVELLPRWVIPTNVQKSRLPAFDPESLSLAASCRLTGNGNDGCSRAFSLQGLLEPFAEYLRAFVAQAGNMALGVTSEQMTILAGTEPAPEDPYYDFLRRPEDHGDAVPHAHVTRTRCRKESLVHHACGSRLLLPASWTGFWSGVGTTQKSDGSFTSAGVASPFATETAFNDPPSFTHAQSTEHYNVRVEWSLRDRGGVRVFVVSLVQAQATHAGVLSTEVRLVPTPPRTTMVLPPKAAKQPFNSDDVGKHAARVCLGTDPVAPSVVNLNGHLFAEALRLAGGPLWPDVPIEAFLPLLSKLQFSRTNLLDQAPCQAGDVVVYDPDHCPGLSRDRIAVCHDDGLVSMMLDDGRKQCRVAPTETSPPRSTSSSPCVPSYVMRRESTASATCATGQWPLVAQLVWARKILINPVTSIQGLVFRSHAAWNLQSASWGCYAVREVPHDNFPRGTALGAEQLEVPLHVCLNPKMADFLVAVQRQGYKITVRSLATGAAHPSARASTIYSGNAMEITIVDRQTTVVGSSMACGGKATLIAALRALSSVASRHGGQAQHRCLPAGSQHDGLYVEFAPVEAVIAQERHVATWAAKPVSQRRSFSALAASVGDSEPSAVSLCAWFAAFEATCGVGQALTNVCLHMLRFAATSDATSAPFTKSQSQLAEDCVLWFFGGMKREMQRRGSAPLAQTRCDTNQLAELLGDAVVAAADATLAPLLQNANTAIQQFNSIVRDLQARLTSGAGNANEAGARLLAVAAVLADETHAALVKVILTPVASAFAAAHALINRYAALLRQQLDHYASEWSRLNTNVASAMERLQEGLRRIEDLAQALDGDGLADYQMTQQGVLEARLQQCTRQVALVSRADLSQSELQTLFDAESRTLQLIEGNLAKITQVFVDARNRTSIAMDAASAVLADVIVATARAIRDAEMEVVNFVNELRLRFDDETERHTSYDRVVNEYAVREQAVEPQIQSIRDTASANVATIRNESTFALYTLLAQVREDRDAALDNARAPVDAAHRDLAAYENTLVGTNVTDSGATPVGRELREAVTVAENRFSEATETLTTLFDERTAVLQANLTAAESAAAASIALVESQRDAAIANASAGLRNFKDALFEASDRFTEAARAYQAAQAESLGSNVSLAALEQQATVEIANAKAKVEALDLTQRQLVSSYARDADSLKTSIHDSKQLLEEYAARLLAQVQRSTLAAACEAFRIGLDDLTASVFSSIEELLGPAASEFANLLENVTAPAAGLLNEAEALRRTFQGTGDDVLKASTEELRSIESDVSGLLDNVERTVVSSVISLVPGGQGLVKALQLRQQFQHVFYLARSNFISEFILSVEENFNVVGNGLGQALRDRVAGFRSLAAQTLSGLIVPRMPPPKFDQVVDVSKLVDRLVGNWDRSIAAHGCVTSIASNPGVQRSVQRRAELVYGATIALNPGWAMVAQSHGVPDPMTVVRAVAASFIPVPNRAETIVTLGKHLGFVLYDICRAVKESCDAEVFSSLRNLGIEVLYRLKDFSNSPADQNDAMAILLAGMFLRDSATAIAYGGRLNLPGYIVSAITGVSWSHHASQTSLEPVNGIEHIPLRNQEKAVRVVAGSTRAHLVSPRRHFAESAARRPPPLPWLYKYEERHPIYDPISAKQTGYVVSRGTLALCLTSTKGYSAPSSLLRWDVAITFQNATAVNGSTNMLDDEGDGDRGAATQGPSRTTRSREEGPGGPERWRPQHRRSKIVHPDDASDTTDVRFSFWEDPRTGRIVEIDARESDQRIAAAIVALLGEDAHNYEPDEDVVVYMGRTEWGPHSFQRSWRRPTLSPSGDAKGTSNQTVVYDDHGHLTFGVTRWTMDLEHSSRKTVWVESTLQLVNEEEVAENSSHAALHRCHDVTTDRSYRTTPPVTGGTADRMLLLRTDSLRQDNESRLRDEGGAQRFFRGQQQRSRAGDAADNRRQREGDECVTQRGANCRVRRPVKAMHLFDCEHDIASLTTASSANNLVSPLELHGCMLHFPWAVSEVTRLAKDTISCRDACLATTLRALALSKGSADLCALWPDARFQASAGQFPSAATEGGGDEAEANEPLRASRTAAEDRQAFLIVAHFYEGSSPCLRDIVHEDFADIMQHHMETTKRSRETASSASGNSAAADGGQQNGTTGGHGPPLPPALGSDRGSRQEPRTTDHHHKLDTAAIRLFRQRGAQTALLKRGRSIMRQLSYSADTETVTSQGPSGGGFDYDRVVIDIIRKQLKIGSQWFGGALTFHVGYAMEIDENDIPVDMFVFAMARGELLFLGRSFPFLNMRYASNGLGATRQGAAIGAFAQQVKRVLTACIVDLKLGFDYNAEIIPPISVPMGPILFQFSLEASVSAGGFFRICVPSPANGFNIVETGAQLAGRIVMYGRGGIGSGYCSGVYIYIEVAVDLVSLRHEEKVVLKLAFAPSISLQLAHQRESEFLPIRVSSISAGLTIGFKIWRWRFCLKFAFPMALSFGGQSAGRAPAVDAIATGGRPSHLIGTVDFETPAFQPWRFQFEYYLDRRSPIPPVQCFVEVGTYKFLATQCGESVAGFSIPLSEMPPAGTYELSFCVDAWCNRGSATLYGELLDVAPYQHFQPYTTAINVTSRGMPPANCECVLSSPATTIRLTAAAVHGTTGRFACWIPAYSPLGTYAVGLECLNKATAVQTSTAAASDFARLVGYSVARRPRGDTSVNIGAPPSMVAQYPFSFPEGFESTIHAEVRPDTAEGPVRCRLVRIRRGTSVIEATLPYREGVRRSSTEIECQNMIVPTECDNDCYLAISIADADGPGFVFPLEAYDRFVLDYIGRSTFVDFQQWNMNVSAVAASGVKPTFRSSNATATVDLLLWSLPRLPDEFAEQLRCYVSRVTSTSSSSASGPTTSSPSSWGNVQEVPCTCGYNLFGYLTVSMSQQAMGATEEEGAVWTDAGSYQLRLATEGQRVSSDPILFMITRIAVLNASQPINFAAPLAAFIDPLDGDIAQLPTIYFNVNQVPIGPSRKQTCDSRTGVCQFWPPLFNDPPSDSEVEVTIAAAVDVTFPAPFVLPDTCPELCTRGTCDVSLNPACFCPVKGEYYPCEFVPCDGQCLHDGFCDWRTGKCRCSYGWTGVTCEDRTELESVFPPVVSTRPMAIRLTVMTNATATLLMRCYFYRCNGTMREGGVCTSYASLGESPFATNAPEVCFLPAISVGVAASTWAIFVCVGHVDAPFRCATRLVRLWFVVVELPSKKVNYTGGTRISVVTTSYEVPLIIESATYSHQPDAQPCELVLREQRQPVASTATDNNSHQVPTGVAVYRDQWSCRVSGGTLGNSETMSINIGGPRDDQKASLDIGTILFVAVPCRHASCSGHGTCRPTGICVCQEGWFTATCGAASCVNLCSGHGACLPPAPSVPVTSSASACQCSANWTGIDCSAPSTCGPASCALQNVGDGVCDVRCLHAACADDGGDCASPLSRCRCDQALLSFPRCERACAAVGCPVSSFDLRCENQWTQSDAKAKETFKCPSYFGQMLRAFCFQRANDFICDTACIPCEGEGTDCVAFNQEPEAAECSPGCSNEDVGDGLCQPLCNVPGCDHDRKDCLTLEALGGTRSPCAENCPYELEFDSTATNCHPPCNVSACAYQHGVCVPAGCAPTMLGDGVCQAACNVSRVQFDRGDCALCGGTCRREQVNNGRADPECIGLEACGFDGLDAGDPCAKKTCALGFECQAISGLPRCVCSQDVTSATAAACRATLPTACSPRCEADRVCLDGACSCGPGRVPVPEFPSKCINATDFFSAKKACGPDEVLEASVDTSSSGSQGALSIPSSVSLKCACPFGFVTVNETAPQPRTSCVDFDECANTTHCRLGEKCVNLPGTYQCQPNNMTSLGAPACASDELWSSETGKCECRGAGIRRPNGRCVADLCSGRACPAHSHCEERLDIGSAACVCDEGLEAVFVRASRICRPPDPCRRMPLPCGPLDVATCVSEYNETSNTFPLRCVCTPPYEAASDSSTVCQLNGGGSTALTCPNDGVTFTDGSCGCAAGKVRIQDRCELLSSCHPPCGPLEQCSAQHTCDARSGYERVLLPEGTGYLIRDIDECLASPCPPFSRCRNVDGGFMCDCPAGYLGNSSVGCCACSAMERCVRPSQADGAAVSFLELSCLDCPDQGTFFSNGSCVPRPTCSQRCPSNMQCRCSAASGSTECRCVCNTGYVGIEGNVGSCQAVDPCQAVVRPCAAGMNCTNREDGTFACSGVPFEDKWSNCACLRDPNIRCADGMALSCLDEDQAVTWPSNVTCDVGDRHCMCRLASLATCQRIDDDEEPSAIGGGGSKGQLHHSRTVSRTIAVPDRICRVPNCTDPNHVCIGPVCMCAFGFVEAAGAPDGLLSPSPPTCLPAALCEDQMARCAATQVCVNRHSGYECIQDRCYYPQRVDCGRGGVCVPEGPTLCRCTDPRFPYDATLGTCMQGFCGGHPCPTETDCVEMNEGFRCVCKSGFVDTTRRSL